MLRKELGAANVLSKNMGNLQEWKITLASAQSHQHHLACNDARHFFKLFNRFSVSNWDKIFVTTLKFTNYTIELLILVITLKKAKCPQMPDGGEGYLCWH